jgi:hypothetical protein
MREPAISFSMAFCPGSSKSRVRGVNYFCRSATTISAGEG